MSESSEIDALPLERSEPRRRVTAGRRRGQVPWLLAVPGVVFLLAFHFVPIGFGGWYAFTDRTLTHSSYIGLGNFRAILRDPLARGAVWHTLELAFCFVAIVNVLGLTLALGLNRAVRTRHFLRLLFFLPVALSPLAVSYIWRWIFDYQGALNLVLSDVGLASLRRPWIGDPSTALWTILVVLVWQYTGLAMVLYLAGLQAISDDILEATLVDGASAWFRVRKVVLPLLAPAVTVSVTYTLIIGLRVFDQVLALTGGGPVSASETLASQIYKQTFFLGRFGYGAAFALILTALILTLSLTQLAVLRRNEARL
jgi:raffinose/stachyose/melibiose transport system permease protein